jgi:non-ribosomal peptide synthetase-like protein
MSMRTPSHDTKQLKEQNSAVLLHEFFARSVARHAHRVAVDVPPGSGRPNRRLLAYAELEQQSNVIAGALSGLVGRECVIAILLPRGSEHLYSSQLAVLKTGAAFTCLDPSFPDDRIREILQDCEAVALLTDSNGRERCRHAGYEEKRMIHVAELIEKTRGSTELLTQPDWLTGESLAYIIYTSGTTGRPKGVMIEHRSIANLVASDLAEFALSPDARVGQSSSSAYDSSIEETWLALASGATLVVMDADTTRLGPDLVSWLNREQVTVLCPPPTLLRATGCENPEKELPHLSLLYVGGEALPRDLADSWSRGRQMVNGYGPTECTVTALRGGIRKGGPITIGRPIAGMKAWVLDETLQEVPDGQWGELCIGGIGLARGYWKQPESTSEKFILHPRFGRIYRTGDIVHCESNGSFFYHGRRDAQAKIRGYRLELEEVEAHLLRCPGVYAAVCAIQGDEGQQHLVAFVVPENPEFPPPFDDLKTVLQATLPSYMVPARFGLLADIPISTNGKIDRNSLPHLGVAERSPKRDATTPRDSFEARLEEAFRTILGLKDSISVHDDFFADLGGDSLRAAQLVSMLRREERFQQITVRDIYEKRTVAALALQMRAWAPGPAASGAERARPAGKILIATTVQACWLLAIFLLVAILGYFAVFTGMPWLVGSLGLIPSILLLPLIISSAVALYTPLAVLATAAVKLCLVGRYRPLRAPVWGSFYLRNWIVEQIARTIPWQLLAGTEFQLTALRILGARVGSRVHIHRGVDLSRGGWDLLEIGDHVTIGQDAFIRLVELDSGHIVVGPVSLGNGATVDTRAGVAGNTKLAPGAYLSPLSSLPAGEMIPENERWEGIPAVPAGQAPPRPDLPDSARILSPLQYGLLLVLMRFGISLVPPLAIQLPAVTAAALWGLDARGFVNWVFAVGLHWTIPLIAIVALAGSMVLFLGLMAVAVRMLGRAPAGVINVWSLSYIRVWLKTGMIQSAGTLLSGTLFWPLWLRTSGMKIGSGCEISTIIDVVPELIEIGRESFFADGVYLGGPHVHRGTVTLAATSISENTFLGNHTVIPAGLHLPENVLIGICTVADDQRVRANSSWFGHPSFELPRREVVECKRRFTHEPSRIRYLNRVAWELLRFLLPAEPLVITLIWIKALDYAEIAVSRTTFLFIAVPLLSLAAAALPCFLVLGLKWGLLGRVRPGRHPLWSCWCSRWDFLYVAWRMFAVPFLTSFEGTPLLAGYLRAMGAKIGKRVVLGKGFAQVVDPDMLCIEDEATVNAMFQAHTFEDRVLKIDRIHIGCRATLGPASVPLYGADIGVGAHVAPHSVIMKHEFLLPGFRYEGCPTRTLQSQKEYAKICDEAGQI